MTGAELALKQALDLANESRFAVYEARVLLDCVDPGGPSVLACSEIFEALDTFCSKLHAVHCSAKNRARRREVRFKKGVNGVELN